MAVKINCIKAVIVIVLIQSSFTEKAFAGEPGQLSLERALAIAGESNSEVISARKEMESADAKIVRAKTYMNPEFNIEIRPSGIETEFGQEFSIMGKKSIIRKIAEIEKKIIECKLNMTVKKVMLEVKKVYFQVLLAVKKKEFSVENLNLARNFLAITEQRYNTGNVAKDELLRAEIEVSRSRNELMTVEKEILATKDKLNYLLNMPYSEEYICTGRFNYEKKVSDIEALLEEARKNRDDMKAMKLMLDAKQLELKLIKKERLSNPELSLLADSESGGPVSIGAGLRMALPFWDRKKGDITLVNSEMEKAELALENFGKRVELEVKNVYRELDLADRQVVLMDKSRKKAEELLSLIEVRFAEGKMSFLGYLESLIVYREANMDYLEAILDYRVKLASLNNIIGGGL